ncbi:MAG: FAD-dependent oxidoreductase [Dehalococcoidia bacterium]|nr:FAD-dependent oxidoreductase [Dehalococcoidia bacterium]
MSGTDRADIIVIGAGVVGLAVAYEAARRGHSVLVLERDRVGAGAAGVAAGMLAPASEAECEDTPFLSLALESCELYPEWVASVEADSGIGCRYRSEGSLLVALHRDHFEELERLAAIQRQLGLEVTWLDSAAIQAREPALSPRVVGGAACRGRSADRSTHLHGIDGGGRPCEGWRDPPRCEGYINRRDRWSR